MSDPIMLPSRTEFLKQIAKKSKNYCWMYLLRMAVEHIDDAIATKTISFSSVMLKEGNFTITVDPTVDVFKMLINKICEENNK